MWCQEVSTFPKNCAHWPKSCPCTCPEGSFEKLNAEEWAENELDVKCNERHMYISGGKTEKCRKVPTKAGASVRKGEEDDDEDPGEDDL